MEKRLLLYHDKMDLYEKMYCFFRGEDFKILSIDDKNQLAETLESDEAQLLLWEMEGADKTICCGIKELAEIRKNYDIPIIVVCREKVETDWIMALNAGADDCVAADCNPLELLARVKCHLRKCQKAITGRTAPAKLFSVGGLEIDDMSRSVTVDGKDVKLTPTEYNILKFLVQKNGKAVSAKHIYESVWHMQAHDIDNTISVHIRHIREKIEADPRNPQYLRVEWGSGYKVG